jgi:antitoxin component of RelBE/YafQ-DinJ toxin-antitoxin module
MPTNSEETEGKTITVKVDLVKDDQLRDMFFTVKKEMGLTINAEVLRVLIKEEYDRRQKIPFSIDDPLLKQISEAINEHPELGFKDTEDFLRTAARRQLVYGSSKPQ